MILFCAFDTIPQCDGQTGRNWYIIIVLCVFRVRTCDKNHVNKSGNRRVVTCKGRNPLGELVGN